MLQPRRSRDFTLSGYFCALLFLCLCFETAVTGNAEHLLRDRTKNGERIRRHDGEVTILSLEENAKSPRALGVLTSTARTFVQGGTTTEFTTQVLGTTLGKTYARLLSTGSRVFYDNVRPSTRGGLKPTDAYLVFPTVLPSVDPARVSPTESDVVQATKALDDVQKVQEIVNNHDFNRLTLDELFDLSDTRQNIQKVLPPSQDDRENVVSVRKEYSVKRNSDIKPAKVVRPNNDLPTFTVRHEFAPSGFSIDDPQEKKEDLVKPGNRNGKALFRGGIPVKQEKKLDTVTYFGFADFTTTVGDTVIVFMPKTPDPQLAGAVTSITGEATLRPEDAVMPVVTTVKTFMSHSPGMATKTVTGHSLSMHKTLSTIQADPVIRESKAYQPVYVGSQSDDDVNRFGIDPSVTSPDYNDPIQPSMEEITPDDLKTTKATATEPLSTYATTTTQVYNSAEEALGLVKSIGGTEAFNGTTTVFTSFVFGTIIEGAYQQLIQSASKVFIDVGDGFITTTGVGIGLAPSTTSTMTKSVDPEGTTLGSEVSTTEELEATTEGSADTTSNDAQVVFPEETTSENELSNEVDTARKVDSPRRDQTIVPDIVPQSTADYVTKIIPSTAYKTFTYLTTFFIPDEKGGQTTSIRSREVTSEDISYVTTTINANEAESFSPTITPTEVTTEAISTTTPQETTTVTEEAKTEATTPQLPVTSPDLITTPQILTTTELEEEEEKTTPSPTTPKLQEEEVDLIFKTLYTTYTYLTTFFQESTTSVSSREVVVTNVITTTLDNSFATDNPAVAGLFNRGQSTLFPSATDVLEPAPTSVGIGRPTTKYFEDTNDGQDDDLFTSTLESVDIEKELQTATPALDSVNEINEDGYKTFYTTYTYFTTVFVDGETEVESRTEVYTNIINPSTLSADIKPTPQVELFSSDYVSVLPDEQVESPEELLETKSPVTLRTTPTRVYDRTISRPKIKDNEIAPLSETLSNEFNIQATNIDDAYKYDTTMTRGHLTDNTQTVDDVDVMSAKQQELSKEEKLLLGITPSEDPEVRQTVVVDVTSSSSGGTRKVYRESYDDPDDQITSESNTEEIEPSFSPTVLLQTSYTTFTYFTTVYKGTTSDVISRLDTVTNVVTETLKPSDIEASLSPEEATLPITYFTTFTYWTTLYKDGNTMVTSREETISNIVTPTVTDIKETESIEITPTTTTSLVLPTVLTSVVGENSVDSPLEPKQLDSNDSEVTPSPAIITPSPASPDVTTQEKKQEEKEQPLLKGDNSTVTSHDLEPTTFYTTYTYFTTSYIGNSTVLNSRLETVTNIVTPTPEVTGSFDTTDTNVMNKDKVLNMTQTTEGPVLKPTGLISTIRTSEVNNGITTLLSTDVFGTYIDGLYAQILESSTQIVPTTGTPMPTTTVKEDLQPTGIVSINEGKIVDADGISTTFFTTKAVGTYIDQLYAQVIESTSSVQVDEEKKTAAQSLDPSTTVVGTKTFRTGLVRLIEGSIVKDKTTTFYESRVIGTLIEGRYAQIIESTSSFKVDMTPTPVPGISPTTTLSGGNAISPTATVTTSPSPAVIESSIGDDGSDQDDNDENEEEDADNSKGRGKTRLSFSTRKKTFTPVIRPFASRGRPTFLPKKKNGDVGTATTITRNAFTPTITATPAVKTTDRGFGTSRNRFSGGRRTTSSNGPQATPSPSTGRRFSGRRGTATTGATLTPTSQNNYRGRSTGRVSPTATVALNSNSRRGGFNYRTSAGPRGTSTLPANSRFRIRPTLSAGVGRPLQTVSTTTEDVVNTNDIGGTTVVTEETLYTVQDEEQETSPPTTTTTTESARRSNNPLLRFRRPPILQRSSTTTTTPKPTTQSARRNSLLRRPDSRGTTTTPATPTRNRPAPTFPPRNRQRPSNNLFPPRGLLRKPSPAEEAEEEEKEEDKVDEHEQNDAKLDEENDFADNDYEGSEHSESQHSTTNETSTTEAVKADRRGKAFNPVQIKPFQGFKRPRTKRQAAEYGARSYRSRYQRPTSRTPSPDYYVDDSEPVPSEPPTTRSPSRYTSRSRGQAQSNQPRVRPTKASTTSERAQFTLRDKSSSQSTRSNFKRPTSRRRTPETTSAPQRPKPPRLRSQTSHNQQQDTTYTSRNSGRRFTNRGRTTSRSRYRDSTDFDTYSFSPSSFDGTITVTHQIPTEVTIPVVNGKVTEYKNVITAKPSLETLGPHQYTTATGKNGNVMIQLTTEVTSTLQNGVMEVTKFVVYETPTTSITFTPTTLRGRKTSFSHIVPSTVYDVKQEVSTVQPQIAANAPLANLLLSQLLLGNLNLQPNGQQINPLLGLQNQQMAPPTPTTEFKTKTTTYVTTVTDHTSTVLPLTFRGKEILTTIVDSSTQVITATEYLTETVVVTPTAALGTNPQQINSLLIPALLQAQLLGAPSQQPTVNPLLGNLQQQILPQDILNIQEEKLQVDEPAQRFVSRRRPTEDVDERSSLQESEQEDIIEQPKFEPKSRKKVKGKNGNKKPPDVPLPATADTSVITLYVSGRRPGEFSTVLSTVTLGEESTVTVRKREAEYIFDDVEKYKVESSKLPDIGSSFSVPDDEITDFYVMSALNEVALESSELETQSLESIVGDVSRYITSDKSKVNTKYILGNPTVINQDPSTDELVVSFSKTNKKSTGHFLSKSPAEVAPHQRKGQENFNWSNKTIKDTDDSIFYKHGRSIRIKRQLEPTEQPRRRKVRVLVPVQRRVNFDEDLTPSEAQRSHDITHQELLQTQDALSKLSDFGTRKVKVIRKRPKNEKTETSEQPTPLRRRVAVRRRRPVTSPPNENSYQYEPQDETDTNYYNIQPSEIQNQDVPDVYPTETLQPIEPTQRRRKVLVTRKRPVPSPINVEPTTRRRVIVTKRRPITKSEELIEPATIFSNFFGGLQTDYDYDSPSINTELEGTNDYNEGNNENRDKPIKDMNPPESGDRDFSQEEDIDNIRIPAWVPGNQPDVTFHPFVTSEIQNSNIPESIVWFYEPTDGVTIDITPTTTETITEPTLNAYDTLGNLTSSNDSFVDVSTPPSLVDDVEITSVNPEVTESPVTESEEVPTSSPESNATTTAKELEKIKNEPDEALEFEGTPKFVRPTRFSVTRKPTRTITGYPGTRRRQPVSTLPLSTTTSYQPSYRTKKPTLKKFGVLSSTLSLSETDIAPTKTKEVLLSTDVVETTTPENIFPSDITLDPSTTDNVDEQTTTTTPTLAESSPEQTPELETPLTPATPTAFLTTTVTSTRLRTYTYVVTRVNGDESIVTSSTSVKPAVKTLTLTIPVLAYTHSATEIEEGRGFALATKVMSNGVEVIVAGDRTTMPGAPDLQLRRLTAITRPTTLAPSTLSDAMMMLLPQQSTQEVEGLVTKTYLTTYTYLTTLLERGETVVNSREEVVPNVVTEERRPTMSVTPTPVTKVTLTASPTLVTGVFHTTYTYLNTLVDGEVPLVLTTKRTVANTVTAPEDLLQPSEVGLSGLDTNTYLNTVAFTKTLADGADFKIVSTKDVMTQVIITESDNKVSTVEIKPTATAMTTDVVKTYFVTYTYFSTMLDGEDTVVHSEIATSSDIVTETFVIPTKRTNSNNEDVEKITATKTPEINKPNENPINVFATKTYLTTFTYFTTLLQDNNGKGPTTVVTSRTNVIQNIVTETLNTDLFDSNYLSSLRNSFQTDNQPIVGTATFNDGQKMEITAVGEQPVKQTVSPTQELSTSFEETSGNNNVITGSTIIFFDENDQIDNNGPTPTKTLAIEVAGHTKLNQQTSTENQDTTETSTDNSQSESLSAAESQALTLTSEDSESEEGQQAYETSILSTSTVTKTGATLLPGAQVIKFKDPNGNVSIIPVSDPVSKHPDGTHTGSGGTGTSAAVSNFLNLGSLGINSLNALGPVINAMAGLIKNNLKADQKRRNDTIGINANEPSDLHLSKNPLMTYAGPKPPPVRSPIYIPVGGLAADSVAEESQNLEGHNIFPDTNQRNKPSVILGRPTMESPLLAGGIPISPGQVITANSDVIIGRPSVHGVRPPELSAKPYRKDDVPIGMKPPPLPKSKPNWPIRDHNGHYIPLNHYPNRDNQFRIPPPRESSYTPISEHLQNYDTINYNPEFFKHPEHYKKRPFSGSNRPTTHNDFFIPPNNNEPNNVNVEQKPQLYNNQPYNPPQQNIQVYKNIPNNNFDTRPTVHSDTEALNTVNSNVEYVNPNQHIPGLLPDNTDFVDQSALNPLLVNIQPSNVANVIIPFGSTTALIYSGEHSQKGEIFNDPSPYPNAEVDHVVDALSTSRPAPEGEGITHAARVPINTNNLDVPVAPHGINVAAGNQQVYQSDRHQQPDQHKQHVYQPKPLNQQAYQHKQQGYQANQQNQQGYQANQQIQQGYQANQQNQQGYQANQQNQQGYQANQQNQQGHQANQQNQQGYQTNQPNQQVHQTHQNNQQEFQTNQQNKPVYQLQPDHQKRRPGLVNKNPNYINQQYYPDKKPDQSYVFGLGEYLKPPPPPPHRYHGSDERPSDDEFVFGDEPVEQEGGEVIQESNTRPLRPGQLPPELSANPSTSMPIDPVDDDKQENSGTNINYNRRPESPARPGQDVNFSVVNSKPVQLDGISSINNQAPIINGRPGLNKFTEQSQATLAVGSPTKLRPDGSSISSNEGQQNYNHNDRPTSNVFVKPALFAAVNQGDFHERPMIVEPVYFDSKKTQSNQPKPIRDITVQTMNLDEKPPPPIGYETPPPPHHSAPTDLDTQANTPKPFNAANPTQSQFDRNSQQDDSVVGLSPPPPEGRYPVHEETSTRPALTLGGPQRRPILHPQRKPRPPPPYKFEIPPPPENKEVSMPTLPPNLEPPKLPMLPETLSPPKSDENYFHKTVPKRPTSTSRPDILQQWASQSEPKPIIVAQQDVINPVLKGVLTVEEQPQQPEVITADSKVVLTNVIKGQIPKPEGGIRITGSQPSLQTVVVGKPVPVPVTDTMPNIVISPTAVEKPNKSHDWQDGFIVGTETIIDDKPHFATPIKEQPGHSGGKRKTTSVLVTSGVTTIFGNLFTRPTTPTTLIKPTKSMDNHHTAIKVVVEPKNNSTKSTEKQDNAVQNDRHQVTLTVEGSDGDLDLFDDIVTAPPPTTFVVTHTQTTTVTTTETTVVHSKGKEPSTHTLVLTKTQTSTVLDTVTEVHTLVEQTSILSTVTTTIPQATATVYTGSVIPEEYPVFRQGEAETTKSPDKSQDKPAENPHENESIFVVMTDKKSGSVHVPIADNRPPPEIQVPDETNEISPNVLLGNVLTHHSSDSECRPECKASRNELCQKIDNVMRCVCRPGFARMFPDRPCKPTYTYTMRLVLDRYGKDQIRYAGALQDPSSGPYQRLVDATREGLDRMVMQSDLRDIYHGVEVRGFEPARTPDNAIVKFYVQLSDNTEESRLQDVLRKSLRSNNYSLGGTEVYAAKEQIQYLLAEDFDECTDPKYHDCSEDAQCFNLRGTYTCSCKEGFSDLSPNTLFPGRLCSAEQIGCEQCNFHGTCYSRSDEETVCECFQWYGGATCQLNLKVLLLILVTVGVCLVVLLVVCVVLACMKRRSRGSGPARGPPGGGFRRYRSHTGTGDKRAMISVDTSSEGSVDHTPPAYIKQAAITAQRQNKMLRKAGNKGPAPLHMPVSVPVGTMEQRDRSLTVMIPRAKYRPAPTQPATTLLTMSTFGPEQKLLNYLNPEGRSTPDKQGSRNTSRKPSNSTTQSEQIRSRKPSSQPPPPRKPSTGALVSAGFEVSATVGRTKELDEAFLESPHTDLSQQGFNTIRTAESSIIVDIPPPPTLEAELEDIISKVDRLTVSEARSYDETTIHPPTKSLHRDYDSKRLSSSSHRANDEGHTMVERDIGSTFMMPQTHLFKNDRGSDISNFDSL